MNRQYRNKLFSSLCRFIRTSYANYIHIRVRGGGPDPPLELYTSHIGGPDAGKQDDKGGVACAGSNLKKAKRA